MALNAPYYIAGEGEVRDPSQWVPESSRRARAFPLYCGLKSLGRKGVLEMVEQNCRQARLMASLLSDDPMVTILNDVVLNQVLVRFSCPGSDSDAFTRMVTAAVQEEGTAGPGEAYGREWPPSRCRTGQPPTTISPGRRMPYVPSSGRLQNAEKPAGVFLK